MSDQNCYRHPGNETGIVCQRCDRPICTSCMNQASVGFHCPECVKSSKQKVYTANTLPGASGTITKALVGINAAAFVLAIAVLGSTVGGAGLAARDFGLWGPAIDVDTEWWRIITSGFLHSGIIHIAFNMYLLWQLGQQLERAMGQIDFVLVYFVTLIGGSAGALLLAPNSFTVGASGAVFGLIGLMVFFLRSRHIGLFDTGLGMLIVINVIFSFRGGVSLGGHLGGFVTGVVLGILYFGLNPGDGPLLKGKTKETRSVTIGLGVLPVSYTHLTLPTNREV